MRLFAMLDGEENPVVVHHDGEGGYRIEIGDHEHDVDARRLEENTWSLLIDGHSYEVDVEPDPRRPDGLVVRVRDERFAMEILDERRMRMRAASSGFDADGEVVVLAPMPGRVVRVLVKKGDEIEEGAPVVVVEAMKMENELTAPKAGVVREVRVQEGDAVDGAAPLVVIG